MSVEYTKYSKGDYRVVAIYQINDKGSPIMETVRYAVVDSRHSIISQHSSLSEAATAMEHLANQRVKFAGPGD